MAFTDYKTETSLPISASEALDAAYEELPLPRGASKVDVYLNDPAAGAFAYSNAGPDLPLPGQSWTTVWERPADHKGLIPKFSVFLKAGGAAKTLFFRIT